MRDETVCRPSVRASARGLLQVMLPEAGYAWRFSSQSNCQDLWIKLFELLLPTTEIGDYGVSFGVHEAGRGAWAR